MMFPQTCRFLAFIFSNVTQITLCKVIWHWFCLFVLFNQHASYGFILTWQWFNHCILKQMQSPRPGVVCLQHWLCGVSKPVRIKKLSLNILSCFSEVYWSGSESTLSTLQSLPKSFTASSGEQKGSLNWDCFEKAPPKERGGREQ